MSNFKETKSRLTAHAMLYLLTVLRTPATSRWSVLCLGILTLVARKVVGDKNLAFRERLSCFLPKHDSFELSAVVAPVRLGVTPVSTVFADVLQQSTTNKTCWVTIHPHGATRHIRMLDTLHTWNTSLILIKTFLKWNKLIEGLFHVMMRVK